MVTDDERAIDGSRRGIATREAHGVEHFRRISQMGRDAAGKTSAQYAEMGRRGGRKTKLMFGSEFFAEIGRKGGLARQKKR